MTRQHRKPTQGRRPTQAVWLLVTFVALATLPSAHAQVQQYETSFIPSPLDPLVGEQVTFTSLGAGGESWDLDGDGACDDALGAVARHRFARAGRYRVTLCISQGRLLTRSTQELLVAEPRATSAIVRFQGTFGDAGAQVRRVRVQRSARAQIVLRCRGRDCPYPRRTVAPGRRVVIFRGLHRLLRGGTRISIFVTQPRRIGKYTGFRVRRGERPPVRRDRCLRLESLRVVRCPD